MFKKYIGDKDFYKQTWKLAFPFALQNMLLSGQGMIDTLMVTRIGMVSAVGTAAQIDTLSGLVSYGVNGGIAMFASQFYGANDSKNLKRCTGLSFILVLSNALFWILMATFFGKEILSFYMSDPVVLENGLLYLKYMKFSLFTGSFSYCLANMYRSTGQAKIALHVSMMSTFINVLSNFLLIFGIGPFPKLGVVGAALGTIIAQTFGSSILLIHSIYTRQEFIGSFSEMFLLDKSFVKPILKRMAPLIINEGTFGFGQTLFIKAFGQLGKESMDAYYVGNQIYNLLTFVIYGYGNAVQILLGKRLGAGEIIEAQKESNYHIGLAGVISIFLVSFLLIFGKPMISLFGLESEISKTLAVGIVYVLALKASMRLYNYMIFCILRSGGDSKIITILDSGLQWAIGIPLAFISVNILNLTSITLVLLVTQTEQLIRVILGMIRVKSYRWANNLTKVVG